MKKEQMGNKSFALGYSMIVNWFIAWAIFNFSNTVTPGLFREHLTAQYGYSSATVLDVVTWGSIIISILFLVLPKFLNRFGTKKIMVVGALGNALTFAVIPFASTAFLLGFLTGLLRFWGGLYCTVSTVAMAGRWFPRKKGTAMGIMTGGGILSSGIFLPIFNKLLENGGIKAAMFGGALISALYGISCIFWIKDTPEEVGLLPDGEPMTEEEKKVHLVAQSEKKSEWGYLDLLKNWKFDLYIIGWLMPLIAAVGFASCYLNYLIGCDIEMSTVITFASLIGVLQLVISSASGILDTKIGVLKSSGIILSVLSITLLSMGLGSKALPSGVLIAMWMICMGCNACMNNLQPSQGMEILGASNYAGIHILVSVFASLSALGNFIVARSLEWTGGYEGALVVFGAMCIIGYVLILIVGTKKLIPPKQI